MDMASQVHDMQNDYNTGENLKNSSLFTGGDFLQELKEKTGANGIRITAYSDGTCVVSPTDADPVSKDSAEDALAN